MHIHCLEGILYFDSNLDEMIYTLTGVELCKSGFVITLAPMQSGTEHSYGQVPQNFPCFKVSERMGNALSQALPTSELHWIQVLPVMFPLPFAHGFPIGQIFRVNWLFIFWKTIIDMAGNHSGYV